MFMVRVKVLVHCMALRKRSLPWIAQPTASRRSTAGVAKSQAEMRRAFESIDTAGRGFACGWPAHAASHRALSRCAITADGLLSRRSLSLRCVSAYRELQDLLEEQ
jgi:hypothetical protein